MSCASTGVHAGSGVDGTAVIEVIFEILFQIVFELIGELLIESGWRAADGATRDALGMQQSSAARRWLGLGLTTLVVAGIGAWRGTVVAGLGWGWWFALAVTVVAAGAAAWRMFRPAGPRPARLAAVTWWPVGRCAWFAVANGLFVVAYAVAASSVAAVETPVLR